MAEMLGPDQVVQEFWRLMASNDFSSVSAVLADEFLLDWPQSGERIRGAERFAQINQEYPAHGAWTFEVRRLVAEGSKVVTDVQVSDGTITATALSFFEAVDGKIVRIEEFWPEPFDAPANRAHLVERIP